MTHASFRYGGEYAPRVLNDIDLQLPAGKVTAIVGPSGSGKTTLLKLLLGFYQPTQGTISLGDTDLSAINPRIWRSRCGVVMQDGFVFANTIARNIALGDESIDAERLRYAADVACIRSFIESLPAGYNTRIGDDGVQISQGQKQRLLIARAVYKDPDYLFFDEATNALDAEHETRILEQLHTFFQGRTVVVVAHRLSTVKRADQIVVLDSGHIVDTGTHAQLIRRRGRYYRLVQNQLELGLSATSFF
jgi:ATP-binding cassette, subfamily B, bacterial